MDHQLIDDVNDICNSVSLYLRIPLNKYIILNQLIVKDSIMHISLY